MDLRRDEYSTPGSIVSSGGAAAASIGDHVEVVLDDRDGPRATYHGQGFRLVSDDASRYSWRCSVSSCPSQLVTYKIDDKHVLYSFKEHDEKEHVSVKGSEHSKKAFQREVVEKIGEYTYVLERTIRFLDIKCWRCQCAGCPSQCRTSIDGKTILHGPTQHTCQQFTPEKELELLQYYYSLRPPLDEPPSDEHAPAAPSDGVASGRCDESLQKREQQHTEIAVKNEESRGSQGLRSTPGLLPRESGMKIDSAVSMGIEKGVQNGHTPPPSHTGPCSSPRPHQRSPSHPHLDATPGSTLKSKILPMPVPNREAIDVNMHDDESSKRDGDEVDEVEPRRSRSRGCGRSNVAGIVSATQLLETMSGSCACAHNKLRTAIYERVFDLMLQKEKLLKVQKRNEVLRGKLLHRLVKNGPLRNKVDLHRKGTALRRLTRIYIL